ncbi:hypothetical protein JW898_03530 [Candidatus Woesearchaeota archaeon]|nr:hypothetical protein [Candidatus Woesearchaeota archaeon]
MVLITHMRNEIADMLEGALDRSAKLGVEVFGLCQYSLRDRRITNAIPPQYFEQNRLVDLKPDEVLPSDVLMEQVRRYNLGKADSVPLLEQDSAYKPARKVAREGGVLIPYRTHWEEESSFFPSAEESNWSFAQNDMFMDLVISYDLRDRGVNPPFCAMFNPRYLPFREDAVRHLLYSLSDLAKLDKEKCWKVGTNAILVGKQVMGATHLSIDFRID